MGRWKLILFLIALATVIPACKSRNKTRDLINSPLEKTVDAQQKVISTATLGSFSFDGTTDNNIFSIKNIRRATGVKPEDLKITDLQVNLVRFENTFHHYPLVIVQKSEAAIFTRFQLCQGSCTGGDSVRDEFRIFDLNHIQDFSKEVMLSVQACTEEPPPENPKIICGDPVSYRDFHKKPLFLKYLPDARLSLLLSDEEKLRDSIRETGRELVKALEFSEPAGLSLSAADPSDQDSLGSLKELGGHLTGEGLLTRATSSNQYNRGRGGTTEVDGCFTREHLEKLSKEEQCRLSQYIGSSTAYIFYPPIKFYWEADILCNNALACTPDYGCARRSEVREYYVNPGDQCIPRDAKVALQVGGSVLLVGGLLGITGATIGYRSIGESSQNAARNKKLAIAGGAVALTAIAVGIWNLVESNNYSLTDTGTPGLVARALETSDELATQLQKQTRLIADYLAENFSD